MSRDGSLTVITGIGGDANGATGNGGAGGSIVNFRHDLALEPEAETLEKPYNVNLLAGGGGSAVTGLGGAGGGLAGVSLFLDGSDSTEFGGNVTDADRDNTVRVSVSTGAGGDGATGGAGGTIRDFASTSVFDQLTPFKTIVLNYVTMSLTAGAGGDGTAGNGGAGGGIVLSKPISGVRFADSDGPSDDPFLAVAGAGGQGSLKGGLGGSITGLTLQNAAFFDGASITGAQLAAATIIAGAGGAGLTSDGGAGGSISKALIGVRGGALDVTAGSGGAGGNLGKGGAGGSVSASTFAVVFTGAPVGLQVEAGAGGAGTLGGGAGGAIATVAVNLPQIGDGVGAYLLAGPGGAANSATGLGGKGGDVTGLVQNKDVNSAINLIAAGYGGANPLGKAGAGGNVTGVKTVGFIGRPSDGVNRLGVFDQGLPQGVFAGSGGDGLVDGIQGSVSNITARQIAAIAAFNSSSFAFSAAAKVSNVKASLIGYDRNADGLFNAAVGNASPSLATPVDGFILATLLDKVSVLPPASFIFTV